jgi:hypothetical protein
LVQTGHIGNTLFLPKLNKQSNTPYSMTTGIHL